jgi:peptidoglycan/LPS O-acetylase OafA/YrhL
LIRIVPLYWLATSLYLLIAAALPALGKSYAPATIAASYLFIPWPQADGTWQPIVGQGWTLNYEMLFYVLFAAAILQRARLAVAAVATVLGLGIIAGFFLPPEWRMLHFWSDPIVAEFALGMAVGLLQRSGVTLRAATRLVLVAIAVGALAVTAFGPFADFPSWARPIVWGLPAMLIVAACALRPEPTRPGLSLAGRIAIALGNASYAIYLFHSFPVRGLLAAALWLHLDALVAGAAASWLFVLLAVLGSIALALAIHYAFERPVTALLRSRAVLTPKWREAGASRA